MKRYRELYLLEWLLRIAGFALVAWVLVLLVIFLGGCATGPADQVPGARASRAVCICILASCDCRRECDE